jgi:hypothetical protein
VPIIPIRNFPDLAYFFSPDQPLQVQLLASCAAFHRDRSTTSPPQAAKWRQISSRKCYVVGTYNIACSVSEKSAKIPRKVKEGVSSSIPSSFSSSTDAASSTTTTITTATSMGVSPVEVFALVTLSSICSALHTQHLTLDSVVKQDRNELISKFFYHEEADQAELAATHVVVTISGQALPFIGGVPMQHVTAITGLNEFVRNRVCSMTDYLASRIFVVENGTAGSFTRSLPHACVLPYSVASDEDLVELARKLCSVEDFEEAKLKRRWMFGFFLQALGRPRFARHSLRKRSYRDGRVIGNARL